MSGLKDAGQYVEDVPDDGCVCSSTSGSESEEDAARKKLFASSLWFPGSSHVSMQGHRTADTMMVTPASGLICDLRVLPTPTTIPLPIKVAEMAPSSHTIMVTPASGLLRNRRVLPTPRPIPPSHQGYHDGPR